MAVRSPENHHIWQKDIQSVRLIHAVLLGLYQDCTRNAPSNKHGVMIRDPVKLITKGVPIIISLITIFQHNRLLQNLMDRG